MSLVTYTVDLFTGQLVLVEKPSAFQVFLENKQKFCQFCMKRIESKSSSQNISKCPKNCNSFWCSAECMEKDQVHVLACKFWAELAGIAGFAGTDYCLLRLLVNLLVLETCMDQDNMPVPYGYLKALVSHHKSFSQEFTDSISRAATDLIILFKDTPLSKTSTMDIVKLACRINSNSHAIFDPSQKTNQAIGCGMFPITSILNHSCSPNAVFFTSSSGDMVVKAIKPISEGEQIFVSYVDLFSPRWERQGTLLTTKHFWCQCTRCESNDKDLLIEAVKCQSGKCSTEYCTELSHQEILDITSKLGIEDAMDFYRAGMFDSAIKSFQDCLCRAKEVLHPHNSTFLQIHVNLANLAGKLHHFSACLKHCNDAIDQYERIIQDADLGYSLELIHILEKKVETLEILKEAQNASLLDSGFTVDELECQLNLTLAQVSKWSFVLINN